MFKIPLPDRWIVVVTGSRLVDDLQKFPDDHVSFLEAAADVRYDRSTSWLQYTILTQEL